MTDSFLDNAGGFTPVPDKLVRDYGFEVAYVWGKVWRYCQMANGACTASHEMIAKRAGMSRRTLIDKLNILIEAGYIEDKTPTLKNKPHTYCTRKGEDKITSAMQISHTEIDISLEDNEGVEPKDIDIGMRNLHSDNARIAQPDTPTVQISHTEDADNAQPDIPTMQNLHLKKEESLNPVSNPNKESKRERESHAHKLKRIGEVDYLSQNEVFATRLSEICGNPHPRYVVNGDRKKLAEAAAQLLDWKVTTEQLDDFISPYWWGDSPPRFEQVTKEWGRYLSSKQKPKNGTGPPSKGPPFDKLRTQPIDKARLDQLQAEDAKEIYNPLKGQ